MGWYGRWVERQRAKGWVNKNVDRDSGIALVILGVGTPILNAYGYEFKVLSWVGHGQIVFGILLAVIGVALIVGWMKRKGVVPRRSKNPAEESGNSNLPT